MFWAPAAAIMRKRTVTSTESGDDKRPRHRNGDNGNNGNNGSGVPVSQVQTQPLQASLPSDGPRPQQVQVPQPHNVNSQCHVPAQPNAHPHPVSHVAHPPAHLPAPFSASGLPSTYSIHPGMYYTLPGRAPSSSNASHGAEAWSPAPGGPSLEAWQKNPYAQPLIDNGGDDDDEDDDSESSDCGDSASDDADDNVDTAGRTKSANGTGRSRGTRDGAQRERSTRRSPKASTSPGRGGGGASAANSEQDGEASGNQTHTAGRRSNRRQNRMASSTAVRMAAVNQNTTSPSFVLRISLLVVGFDYAPVVACRRTPDWPLKCPFIHSMPCGS